MMLCTVVYGLDFETVASRIFKDGQLRASYAAAEGLGEGMVRGFYIDANGTLWVPTEGGLSRIKDGHILTLTNQNGLPCNTVHWMMEDDAHSVWLYLACGLVRIGQSELDAWASHPKQTIQATVFDSSDGVSNHRFTGGYNSVSRKIRGWQVVVCASWRRQRHRSAPSSVQRTFRRRCTLSRSLRMTSLTMRRMGLRLPAGVRDLAIDYTALSLTRRRRCNSASSWRARTATGEAGQPAPRALHEPEAQALPVSCDRDQQQRRLERNGRDARFLDCAGVLPDALVRGARGRRRVRARCGLAIASASVRSLAIINGGWTSASTSARASRESLHDTLLQSFHGLLLRFQTASYLLPERPAEAKEKLDGAIQHAAKAITEGRDAVQGLRASTVERNDLAVAIRTLGDELATRSERPPAPHIQCGSRRPDARSAPDRS